MIDWLLNRVLDLLIPPVAFLALLFWFPVVAAFDTLIRWRNWVLAPSLEGKVVLITGASSGIGQHLAYEFAKRHARLVLVGRKGDRLGKVGEECARLGAWDYVTCEGDTSVESDAKRMVHTALDRFKHLDVLVNNAGVATGDLFQDFQSVDPLNRIMEVDFLGYMWITLHALPFLRRNRGHILVNASVAGFVPMPRLSIYNAAKSAVIQFFDTMRVEPVGRDISITIFFPGATASEMTAGKFVDTRGNVVVDQDKRDLAFGPQPMLRTSTVAQRAVSGMLARSHYVLVPFWFSLPLLLRLFTPELLWAALSWTLMPWVKGTTPPHKVVMDKLIGPKVLYHPPATSQEQAEAAVYEGKGAKVGETKGGAGVLDKAVKGAKQLVQPKGQGKSKEVKV